MKIVFFLVVVFLTVSCSSVKKRAAPLGDNKFLINCDGNGYASSGDTMQCIAEKSNEVCSALGKKFRVLDSSTDSQLHVGVNLATGESIPHTRPHSSATIECY